MAKVEAALLWRPQLQAPLRPPWSHFPCCQSSVGLRARLGSRGAHGSSSHRLCSMTTTTPTPSTACARCCENSWNHPREGYSMLPSLPRKFGERDNRLSSPDLILSPKLTTRRPWGWIYRIQMRGTALPHRWGYLQSFRTYHPWTDLSSKILETRAPVGWRKVRAGLGNPWGGRGFPGHRSITCQATRIQWLGDLGS